MAQRALFLGGTKGLGLETARLALTDGMNVTIAGRTTADCALINGTTVKALPLDLKNVDPTILCALAVYDLIVWTAGIHQQGSFIGLPDVGTDTL